MCNNKNITFPGWIFPISVKLVVINKKIQLIGKLLQFCFSGKRHDNFILYRFTFFYYSNNKTSTK